jgi:hypothetical protein
VVVPLGRRRSGKQIFDLFLELLEAMVALTEVVRLTSIRRLEPKTARATSRTNKR